MTTLPHEKNETAMQASRHACMVAMGLTIAIVSTLLFSWTLGTIFAQPYDASVFLSDSDSMLEKIDTSMGVSTLSQTDILPESFQPIENVPVRISIPELQVDAAVVRAGITEKGHIGVPASFQDVAWYNGSPLPGNPGISILNGHVDNAVGLPGVFAHLGDISFGSEIYITDADGSVARFAVIATTSLSYTARLSDVLALTDPNSPSIAIITCEGAWIPSEKTYDRRMVVIATRVR